MLPPLARISGDRRDAPPRRPRTRVFVVDDSGVVRAYLTRLLRAEADIEVVGTAADGEAAVRTLTDADVDVVLLDVEMPVLDGLTALPQILRATRHPPKVVMASTRTQRGAAITIQALVKGAADYVPKPSSLGDGGVEPFGRQLVERVRLWGDKVRAERARGGDRGAGAAEPHPPPTPRRPGAGPARARVEAIAIGCSTGGPQALLRLFERLAGQRLGPVFITQHMPPTFTTLFAEQLGRLSGRPCREPVDGEPVRTDHLYLAPGDWHMLAERHAGTVHLRRVQTPPENYCRPSVDPMLRSLAPLYGERLLALVLTGMGHDGCAGAGHVVAAGGTVLVQDEASSVVWGMPGAVAQAGLAREILDLDGLATRIRQLVGSHA